MWKKYDKEGNKTGLKKEMQREKEESGKKRSKRSKF